MTEKFKNKYRIATVRATWHDYKGGSYFITICTKNREYYFGEIINGEMKHSPLGQSAINCLNQITSHFPHVEIPVSIVMPNHVHAIVIINAIAPVETQNLASQNTQTTKSETQNLASQNTQTTKSETQNFASQNTQTTKSETQNFASLQRFGPQSKNLASVVRGFKIGVTKFANKNGLSFAWQSRFHDHIIRNQYEMNHIANYIQNNVIRWKDDCFYDNKSDPTINESEDSYQCFF